MAERGGLVERLRSLLEARPGVRLAVLYGSYAYGSPQPRSDVDLAVVVDEPSLVADLAADVAEELGLPEERVSVLDLLLVDPALRLEVLSKGVWLVDRGVDLDGLLPRLSELVEVRGLERSAAVHWAKGDPLDVERLRSVELRLREDVGDLRELLSRGLETVLSDKHLRKSFERTLQTLVEGMLDLLRHLASGLNLGVAAYYRDYVELCVKAGLVSRKVGDAVASLIPVRHALVHGYRGLNYEELWRRAEAAVEVAEALLSEVEEALKARLGLKPSRRD